MWIELANGNSVWDHPRIRCTVFLKKGTKSSWRWVIDDHYSPYTFSSKKKAKEATKSILFFMDAGASFADASN